MDAKNVLSVLIFCISVANLLLLIFIALKIVNKNIIGKKHGINSNDDLINSDYDFKNKSDGKLNRENKGHKSGNLNNDILVKLDDIRSKYEGIITGQRKTNSDLNLFNEKINSRMELILERIDKINEPGVSLKLNESIGLPIEILPESENHISPEPFMILNPNDVENLKRNIEILRSSNDNSTMELFLENSLNMQFTHNYKGHYEFKETNPSSYCTLKSETIPPSDFILFKDKDNKTGYAIVRPSQRLDLDKNITAEIFEGEIPPFPIYVTEPAVFELADPVGGKWKLVKKGKL